MFFTNMYKQAIEAAIDALDIESRSQLLGQLPAAYEMAEFIDRLVGESLDLYLELLNNKQLESLHLVPLAGHPEGSWIEKAKLALDAGYSNEEVALSVYGPVGVTVEWIGSESRMWSSWVERFDKLCSYEDEGIRKVGKAGKAYASRNWEQALERERKEAIYGTW
jgi:hypothetical protein